VRDKSIPPESPRTEIKPDKPRLAVKSLVLENFKSYAEIQEVGPFHTCFSAIVGPNGSGKSNVIDAILFVFGKQAKQLRLNKVSELIHNSDHYTNLDSAKVTVHFYDVMPKEDRYVVVDGSEFSLSRVAYKNNTSAYFIDGKKSKREEVVSLLRERGIDLDNNRFLILQGEVEQIAMMKPKGKGQEVGLLEYLEEIIGTHIYITPIEKASGDLEKLNEDRVEKQNRVKLVIKERDNLEGPKNEAETYLFKEREIIDKQAIIYQIQRVSIEEKLSKLNSKKTKIEEELNIHKQKIEDFLNNLKELEKRDKKESRELESIGAELNKSKSQFQRFEKQNIQLQEEIKNMKEKIQKYEKEIEKAENMLESKRVTLVNNEKTSEEAKKKSIPIRRSPK